MLVNGAPHDTLPALTYSIECCPERALSMRSVVYRSTIGGRKSNYRFSCDDITHSDDYHAVKTMGFDCPTLLKPHKQGYGKQQLQILLPCIYHVT